MMSLPKIYRQKCQNNLKPWTQDLEVLKNMTKIVVVFGASGATGSELIRRLDQSSTVVEVIAVVRKVLPLFENLTKVTQRVIDFQELNSLEFSQIDIGICCLGTTLIKSTREEFIFVERDLVHECAKALHRSGCLEFHLVTGFMSHPDSRFFIPRIKGQGEELVKELDFAKLVIYRPGLLRCRRAESRPMEHLAQTLSNWLDIWNKWSISTSELSQAILKVMEDPDCTGKTKIFEHRDIVDILSC